MKKRKRLNQIAAKQKEQEKQQMQMQFAPQTQAFQPVQSVQVPMGISFGIADCDLGASPHRSKGSLISKAT